MDKFMQASSAGQLQKWGQYKTAQAAIDHALYVGGYLFIYGWKYDPDNIFEDWSLRKDGEFLTRDNAHTFPVNRGDVREVLNLDSEHATPGFLTIIPDSGFNADSRVFLSGESGSSPDAVLKVGVVTETDINILNNTIFPNMDVGDVLSEKLFNIFAGMLDGSAVLYANQLQQCGEEEKADIIFKNNIIHGIENLADSPQVVTQLVKYFLRYFKNSSYTNINDVFINRFFEISDLALEQELIPFDDAMYTARVCLYLNDKFRCINHLLYFLRQDGLRKNDLYAVLEPLLSKTNNKWLKHCFDHSDIDSRQLSSILHTLAAGFYSSGQKHEARLFFRAACLIDTSNGLSAFNLGILHLEAGEFRQAYNSFDIKGRQHTIDCPPAFWPAVAGQPWPAAPLPEHAFSDRPQSGPLPRISIITPSYNQGAFIEETIKSVIHQNYPNLQYIVVDGDSTDGTQEILERYQDRIDLIIREPDAGQTDAINKGIRHADGDIITWLNSDDMAGPGAFHMVADTFMKHDVDIVAGICVEHADHNINIINKSLINTERLNLFHLTDIFEYWYRGFFFYQPEVFFTRRILEKAGAELDQQLKYAMDYELWLRFAGADASLKIINWPLAYFRRHPQQKTFDLPASMEEQAIVRNRYYQLQPDATRREQIREKLESLKGKQELIVGIVNDHNQKLILEEIEQDFAPIANGRIKYICTDDAADQRLNDTDLIIYVIHLQHNPENIQRLREFKNDPLLVGWLWENNHEPRLNHEIAKSLDLTIPAHGRYTAYLHNTTSITCDVLPVCIGHLGTEQAAQLFEAHGNEARSNELYGRYGRYNYARDRNELLQTVKTNIKDNRIILMDEDDINRYIKSPIEDRFKEYCRYKISLITDINNELNQRVFYALLAGQIPLVPYEMTDFDHTVPTDIQQELSIGRFSKNDRDSIMTAYHQALEDFDSGGISAAGNRHRYARENHSFPARINKLLSALPNLSN